LQQIGALLRRQGHGTVSRQKAGKEPLSQERCASENGALGGMISILGGGVICSSKFELGAARYLRKVSAELLAGGFLV